MTNPFFGKCNREALREAVKEMAQGKHIKRMNELHNYDEGYKVVVKELKDKP